MEGISQESLTATIKQQRKEKSLWYKLMLKIEYKRVSRKLKRAGISPAVRCELLLAQRKLLTKLIYLGVNV